MSSETLTAHIASQILGPSIFVSTAKSQTLIRAKARLIDIPKRSSSKLAIQKEHLLPPSPSRTPPPPPTPTPPPPPDSPQLSGFALAESLVLPKRLSNFLNFVSSFDAQYRKNFKSACTDLAVLEMISVLPYGALEDKVQAWIEE